MSARVASSVGAFTLFGRVQGEKIWQVQKFRLPFVAVTDERFPKTSWTLIVRAASNTPEGKKALDNLCRAYRPAILAFIRRHKRSPEDAEDSVQTFFANLARRNDVAKFDPSRGSKFRSWLLGCVKHHLINEFDHDQIQIPPELCDSSSNDAVNGLRHDITADRLYDRLYDRQFALTLLARVIERLRAKYIKDKKEQRFEALLGTITQDVANVPYREIAQMLGMKTNAVKQAVVRLRDSYQAMLREEVATLVNGDPNDPNDPAVREEIRELLAALLDEP